MADLWAAEQCLLLYSCKVLLINALRIDHNTHHIAQILGQDAFQQHSEVVQLIDVNRDDQHPIGLEQALGEPQALLHKAQPLAVPPSVSLVYVAVVVLPVSRPSVVRGSM